MIKYYNRELFRVNKESFMSRGESKKGSVTTFRSIPVGIHSEERIIGKCYCTGENDKQNTRIWAQIQNGKTIVKMNTSDSNLYDTDVYMVAIPFNGIIKPIERSYDYRIFRAVIVKSDKRDIEFEGAFYKNIAYMILVPNMQLLLKEDHKYRKDALSFEFSYVTREKEPVFDMYTFFNSKETTVTLTFTKEGLVSSVKETGVKDDYADDFTKKGQLFPIYKPSEKGADEREHSKKVDMNQDKLKNNEEERKKKKFDKFTQPKTPYVKKEKQQKPQKPVGTGDSKLDEMINEMNRKFSCEHPKADKRSKKKRRK